jgi:hypothetical protein
MTIELADVTTAVAEFDVVSAGLGALQAQYGDVVWEVTTTKGMEAAKAARADLRSRRTELERLRQAGKAPILALGKKVDSEAARIEAALRALEDPIHLQIKTEEGRKERERQERIEAELARVAGIQNRIEDIRAVTTKAIGKDAEWIGAERLRLSQVEIGPDFEEFADTARSVLETTKLALEALQNRAITDEAARVQAQADQAELEQLRRERRERLAREAAATPPPAQETALAPQTEPAAPPAQPPATPPVAAPAETPPPSPAQAAAATPASPVPPGKRPTDAAIVGVVADYFKVDRETATRWLRTMKLQVAA